MELKKIVYFSEELGKLSIYEFMQTMLKHYQISRAYSSLSNKLFPGF